MRREKLSKIILAKVLEMPLGKYLTYVEETTHWPKSPSANRDLRKKRMVYGQVVIKNGELGFVVSDKRLVKRYATHNHTTDRVVCSLKWINTRNVFSLHILKSLLRYQRSYWFSGNEADLKPLSLKEFLSLYPRQYLDQSRLSRLVAQLLVVTPQDEVISLRSLFLSRKKWCSYLIKQLVDRSEDALTDRDIQSLLGQKGIWLSVRTICYCRKLLNIPHYKGRAAHYYGRDIGFTDYLMLSEKGFSRIPDEAGVYELSVPSKIDYVKHKSSVFYIGCSRNLRKRIASYSGNGLKNKCLNEHIKSHDIFVRFFPTENYRALEKELFKNFKNNYGELPKANNAGG